MDKVLVLIPTYNEASSIEHVVAGVLDIPTYGFTLEVLVIDDGSKDGTVDKVTAMGSERVRVLQRTRKEGLGKAYFAGYVAGLADETVTHFVSMDGDDSHRSGDLATMLHLRRYDVVVGSRWVKGGGTVGWPLSRKVLSRGGSLYARFMIGMPYKDITGGFRIYKRAIIEEAVRRRVGSQGYCFQIEMLMLACENGSSIIESPITFYERENGVSKMSKNIVLEAIWNVTKWGLGFKPKAL